MFSRSLRASLLALVVASATATRELSLKVSGPEAVTDSVENLKVKTTITNTGDETLKILNDVRGPLSKLETNTFDIQSSSGASPDFTGIKAKYVMDTVISNNKESSFTVLAPGQSADVEHDLSKAYNFTSSGAGDYKINARDTFTIVDESNQPVSIQAKSESLESKIDGTLAVARRSQLQKRISYNGCSSTQQSQLVTAAKSAQSYAAETYSYLNTHTSSTARYTTWFGTYTSSRHSTVTSHFNNLNNGDYSSFTYDCTCTDADTYAYVYPDDYGKIYLCPVFWQTTNTGTDSRAGTLIHESSHFTKNGGTADNAYGQSAAKALAKSNPDSAVMNADSHEYVAENNPAQS